MLPDNSFPLYFKNYPEFLNFNQFISVTKPNFHHLLPELLPWSSPGLPAFALASDSLKPGIKNARQVSQPSAHSSLGEFYCI